MPVIPYSLLNCVFYLYKSKADAERGQSAGGTGFFVATPTQDGRGHHYGVTNWHVAVDFPVVRINTLNGGVETFEFGPEDWIFEAGKDDIAIVPLSLREPAHIAMFIGPQIFITPDHAANHKIGPGDDVFMIGRFVDLGINRTNVPALRFGNISTLPVPIKQPTGYKEGLSYCIDMHSRTGYSGSPVFVYRTPGNSLEWAETGGLVELGGGMMLLLGIHWGQFPEELLIKKKKRAIAESHGKKEQEEYIKGLSGMTCVIPAWRIMDILNCDTFKEQREKEEKIRK